MRLLKMLYLLEVGTEPDAATSEYTVDWEIFTIKIIRIENFCGVKFSRFVQSAKFFFYG